MYTLPLEFGQFGPATRLQTCTWSVYNHKCHDSANPVVKAVYPTYVNNSGIGVFLAEGMRLKIWSGWLFSSQCRTVLSYILSYVHNGLDWWWLNLFPLQRLWFVTWWDMCYRCSSCTFVSSVLPRFSSEEAKTANFIRRAASFPYRSLSWYSTAQKKATSAFRSRSQII